jgi:hypothetical protein
VLFLRKQQACHHLHVGKLRVYEVCEYKCLTVWWVRGLCSGLSPGEAEDMRKIRFSPGLALYTLMI